MDWKREAIMCQPQPPPPPIASVKGSGETECNARQKQGKLGLGRGGNGVWLKVSWGKEEERCFLKGLFNNLWWFFFLNIQMSNPNFVLVGNKLN